MKKTAILYDFDKTLCTKDMQEYILIPTLGYTDASQFWAEVGEMSRDQAMDPISAYLYFLQKKYMEHGTPLRREDFAVPGQKIELYPGLDTWFERINEYGAKLGLEVEHYVISSGMTEIIESSAIADKFRKIYACRYFYDEEGIARWPAQIVNYTTKTQYIFRINKQVLDESNDTDLNSYVDPSLRPVPFTRMIYVADGITDVPCMRLVKEYGGKSIVVYNPASARAGMTADRLIREGRANYMSAADYRAGKDMENIVKMILDHIGADEKLMELEGKYR